MRRVYARPSCVFHLVLILGSFGVSWEEKPAKGSYSVPLLRTKRDLRDSRGNPTENLKGRPGQGYYIATDLGSPAQRVRTYVAIICCYIGVCPSPTNILAFCNIFSIFLYLQRRLTALTLIITGNLIMCQFSWVLYRTNCDILEESSTSIEA